MPVYRFRHADQRNRFVIGGQELWIDDIVVEW